MVSKGRCYVLHSSMFCALFLKILLLASDLMSLATSELRFHTVGLFLWDAVRDKCYADKPETIDALKDNIHEAIDEIQLHTIDNVLKNWTNRVGYCMARRGSHLNEIIFHY